MILPDITYDTSLQAAYVQTNVFKFADRSHVFFQCQITLCLKDQEACSGITVNDHCENIFLRSGLLTSFYIASKLWKEEDQKDVVIFK